MTTNPPVPSPMPLGITLFCPDCSTYHPFVEQDVYIAQDGQRHPIAGRHTTRVFDEHRTTREEAILSRCLRRLSHWVCTSRDCRAIVTHERPVFPTALPTLSAILAMIAAALAFLGPALIAALASALAGVRLHIPLDAAIAVAALLWVLATALAAAFQDAIARMLFRKEWVPISPARCPRCGQRDFEPLIISKRLRQLRPPAAPNVSRAAHPSAAETTRSTQPPAAVACPACGGRRVYVKHRWTG